MSQRLPQPTGVLIRRLRRVAKYLDRLADDDVVLTVQAQLRARANTCWQSAARLEELITTGAHDSALDAEDAPESTIDS